jgi:hypothetical protein
MKKIYVKILMLIAICIYTGAITYAQTSDSAEKLRLFGVGLHVEQFKFNDLVNSNLNGSISTVLLPVNITQHFRLEPELGVLTVKDKETDDKTTGLAGGLGAFYMFQREKVNIYTGLRFLMDAVTVKSQYFSGLGGETQTDKYSDIKIGPALGFEYLFTKNFSFGGEIGLRYSSMKDVNQRPGVEDQTTKSTMFNFDTGLFIRLFF